MNIKNGLLDLKTQKDSCEPFCTPHYEGKISLNDTSILYKI